MLKSFKANTQAKDEAAANILFTEHSFEGRLLSSSEGLVPAPSAAAVSASAHVNTNLGTDGRPVTMEVKGVDMIMHDPTGATLLHISYPGVRSFVWDHGASSVKVTFAGGGKDWTKYGASLATAPEVFIILKMAVSVELETELRARIRAGMRAAAANAVPGAPTPPLPPEFDYIGLFAGATKPRPFQRRRANLSPVVPDGALPSLGIMRKRAMEASNGLLKALKPGLSQRPVHALDYVHTGANEFPFLWWKGGGISGGRSSKAAALVLSFDGLVVNSSGGGAVGNKLSYEEIENVRMINSDEGGAAGILALNLGKDSAPSEYGLGPAALLPAKTALESFVNNARTNRGPVAGKVRAPIEGSVGGRDVCRVFTLAGPADPPPPPQRKLEIIDLNGSRLAAGSMLKFPKKPSARAKGAAGGGTLMASLGGGDKKHKLESNARVVRHWEQAVLHQGWLQKRRGGQAAVKTAMWRYFVLYSTPQGPFLAYYTDVTDIPLFCTTREERGLVDLATVQYYRPVSSDPTAPAHAFDIVTTDRDWALGAETPAALQAWLTALGRATDQAMALCNEEESTFDCTCRHGQGGPSRSSPMAPSVFALSAMGAQLRESPGDGIDASSTPTVKTFWPYTDIIKYSVTTGPDCHTPNSAINLTFFTDEKFRNKQELLLTFQTAGAAARCISMIDYGIEKFMTTMHVSLEVEMAAKADENDGSYDEDGMSRQQNNTAPVTPGRRSSLSMEMSDDAWRQELMASPPRPAEPSTENAELSHGGLKLYDSEGEGGDDDEDPWAADELEEKMANASIPQPPTLAYTQAPASTNGNGASDGWDMSAGSAFTNIPPAVPSPPSTSSFGSAWLPATETPVVVPPPATTAPASSGWDMSAASAFSSVPTSIPSPPSSTANNTFNSASAWPTSTSNAAPAAPLWDFANSFSTSSSQQWNGTSAKTAPISPTSMAFGAGLQGGGGFFPPAAPPAAAVSPTPKRASVTAEDDPFAVLFDAAEAPATQQQQQQSAAEVFSDGTVSVTVGRWQRMDGGFSGVLTLLVSSVNGSTVQGANLVIAPRSAAAQAYPSLRIIIGNGGNAPPGAPLAIDVTVECWQPFVEPDKLVLSVGGTAVGVFVLPVTLAHFMEPLRLESEAFTTRWNSLTGAAYAACTLAPLPTPATLRGALSSCNLAVAGESAAPGAMGCAAGLLRTATPTASGTNISIAVIAVVDPHGNIMVRSADGNLAQATLKAIQTALTLQH